jgi:hypothetical protein
VNGPCWREMAGNGGQGPLAAMSRDVSQDLGAAPTAFSIVQRFEFRLPTPVHHLIGM